jgi:hypothetical protein
MSTIKPRRLTIGVAAVLAMLVGVVPAALAFDPNNFGFSPLNDGAGPAQEALAMPEATHAFWAGTCDRAAAPPPPPFVPGPAPEPTPIPGGIGGIPDRVYSPNGGTSPHAPVAAPPVPAHCIEWGVPSSLTDVPWSLPPSWRLSAHTQAGGHPDGSTNFALNRSGSGVLIDGSLDNIVVDLPPGLVGDPTAVAECSAEQFRGTPLQCPPESQVGVLHLEIQAVPGAENTQSGNERIYPLYNLEPRKGNAAELGFGYASGEDAVTVRIVAKARTNSDFGVTAFVGQIPAALQVRSQQVTLWGVPWEAANDRWRAPVALGPGTSGCNAQPGVTAVNHYIPPSGLAAGCAQSYDRSWGPVRPFLSNVTECTGGGLSTRIAIDEFQQPGAWVSDGRRPDPVSGKFGGPNGDPSLPPYPALPAPGSTNWRVYSSPAPPMTRCDAVPFDANLDLAPTTAAADSASGLSVDLGIPQEINPPPPAPSEGADQATVDAYAAAATGHWKSDAGLATSHLDKAVVSLPEGFSVNPSIAAGLDGCSDAEVGVREQGNPPLFNNGDPFDGDTGDGAECPLSSIVGEASIDVPLLKEPVAAKVVLGDPKSTDPTSGEMFRMFIVASAPERGLVAKIYGSAVADPNTGKLTATFDRNPRVPFESMRIDFQSGPRGILATPQRCATHGWSSTFTPWTAAHGAGGQPVAAGGAMGVDQNCGFGFAPTLLAGMDRKSAGGLGGKFSFRFDRPDGQQWVRGLTAELPQGLLASVKNVPLCPDAAANAGACGVESRIGSVDAGAGAGSPFFLERKGDVYLTQGYKGCAYGLAVRVPVEAGPFRGQFALSPIVVRQAVCVDRTTAQVTAISDPLPIIHHGIPLRVRQVTVTVDRPGFMRNPTDCSQKQINALFTSAEGAQSAASQPFQASGCKAMPFKPKLALRLTGKRQRTTGKHPGVKAVVTQNGAIEAGVEKAIVRLPLSLALDPANAQALCEFEQGTKPDLENHCPKGSIVGRARAVSPLLRQPLTGNVYFVKNVRRSSTGNVIRTLPMIIVALRGEIAVNLKGESSTTESGKLVNTFANVPDAPITKFNLNINGGKNGILAVTQTRRGRINLCTKPKSHIADTEFDGQNGRRHDRNIRIKTPCANTKNKSKSKSRRRR